MRIENLLYKAISSLPYSDFSIDFRRRHDSSLRSISLLFVALSVLSLAQSSTIGVQYISRLLEIHDRERAPPSVQVAAAYGLLQRLLPSHSSAFEFRIISKEQCGGESCFIIKNHPSSYIRGAPEILITGVTGVEVSAGLHWYLKHWCGSHISWETTGGAQLSSMPKLGSLPRVRDDGILVRRPVPWNYYQNAVSSSYSFAWWDWKRWEKEIDWMGLQGINLPLAFTGQEAIWQKVFQKYNISSSDLDDFFGGPAFLAWSRMANLHGWGGPLPESWFDQQLILQKKILARMYELGMTPVLPAFSGNVPAALKQVFPLAKITRLGNWFSVKSDPRWCCTYLLDATDPLFIEIGRAFIEQQLKEYGRTGHIYNCDTFDENTPPVDDPAYISSLGAAIYSGMQSGDSEAVWLMQGWLFSYDPFWRPPQMKALLLSGSLRLKMILLSRFYAVRDGSDTIGQLFIVPLHMCMLHNFAGNIEMYGILDAIASGPVEARRSEKSTMASDCVFIDYHFVGFVDVELELEILSREGFFELEIILLIVLVDKNRDVIVAFPDVDPSLLSISHERYDEYGKPVLRRAVLERHRNSYDQPHLWYSTSEVIRALELFISSGDELSASKTYRYDLVDLTRQALAKYANKLFLEVIEAYNLNDVHGVSQQSMRFLELVEDMDTLLACHDGFLLGPWLESAKQLAQNAEQEKQFEWNARTQITMWFDNTEEEASLLRDYGNKYWSGLLRDYYGPRAAIYFKYLIESLEKGHGFRLKDWRREWIELTNDWQSSTNLYPVKSFGDTLDTSRWLFDKYLQSSRAYVPQISSAFGMP
ncbi:hypothetical protein JRO89_XS13G0187400 [Xanthoceras sorbifolium]|uniref:Alpha-N-acetylglucosaminidase n=1 Tax=Xanthoceras sorbifolium TaxID=99658 RepID=A0ABQ8H955_9ROSI|nr:hypothetical protein JRO89_XS13G0187400 [Xanthoceras sorbifolium]